MLVLLAWAPWAVGIATVLFLVICIMLIMTVLIQRPQGGGLAGAFGSGAGSGQTAFGAKTGDALTIFTIIVFVLFIVSAIVLNYAHHPEAPSAAAVIQPTTGEEGAPAGETPSGATETTSSTTPAAPTPAAPVGDAPAPVTTEPIGEPKPAETLKPDALKPDAAKTDAPAPAPK